MSFGKTIVLMGVFVLIGMPMVAYLWETINQLLALHVDPTRLVISLPLLAVFVGFLVFVSRQSAGWSTENGDDSSPNQ